MIDRLCQLSPPAFGRAVVLVLLLISLQQVGIGRVIAEGPRTDPVTILGFLPDTVIESQRVDRAANHGLAIGAVLWAVHLGLPWSAWLTAASYTSVMALQYETSTTISHSTHLCALLLWIHAWWYHVYRREIRASIQHGTFWQTPLYPRWVFVSGLFVIGVFHSFAGISKLSTSGIAWVNGVSLQLWVYLLGRPDSIARDVIMNHRSVATALQALTLGAETVAVVGLVARLRPWIGLVLLAFYAGVIDIFSYPFAANAILVSLFYLPVERTVEWGSGRWSRRSGETALRTAAGVWLITLLIGGRGLLFWALALLCAVLVMASAQNGESAKMA